MDLLIISISGAGLYVIFETLREFKAGKVAVNDTSLLFWAGIFFLISIVVNFLSQISGYIVNTKEETYALRKLEEIEGYQIDYTVLSKLDKKIGRLNILTAILHYSSIISMFLGLIVLVVFNFDLF
jgi:cytochrome b subunit of formate dehydrogenase